MIYKIKTYSLEELTEIYIGKEGIERSECEHELCLDIRGHTIIQVRLQRNLIQQYLRESDSISKKHNLNSFFFANPFLTL